MITGIQMEVSKMACMISKLQWNILAEVNQEMDKLKNHGFIKQSYYRSFIV